MAVLARGQNGGQALDAAGASVDVTVTLDAQPPKDSILVAVAKGRGTSTIEIPTPPEGYVSAGIDWGNSATMSFDVFVKRAGADEPLEQGPFTLATDSALETADVGLLVGIIAVPGDPYRIVDALGVTATQNALSLTVPGIETVLDDATLLAVYFILAANRGFTSGGAPAGMTEELDFGAGTFGLQDAGQIGAFSQDLDAAGATGDRTAGVSGTTNTTIRGALLSLSPPLPEPTPNPGMPKVFTFVSGQTTLASVTAWPAGYIRDEDILMVTDPPPINPAGTQGNVAAIRAAFPNNPIWVRTFGLTNIEDLLEVDFGGEVTGLSYIYEDRTSQGDEPEFDPDWTATQANIAAFVAAMEGSGYQTMIEPSGRGLPLRDEGPGEDYEGWDYGVMAALVDYCIVQSQRNAKMQSEATPGGENEVAWTEAIAMVRSQMRAAGVDDYAMQISIGSDTNSIASGDDAYVMFEELADAGIPRLALWPQQSQIAETEEFLALWDADNPLPEEPDEDEGRSLRWSFQRIGRRLRAVPFWR